MTCFEIQSADIQTFTFYEILLINVNVYFIVFQLFINPPLMSFCRGTELQLVFSPSCNLLQRRTAFGLSLDILAQLTLSRLSACYTC